MGYPAKQAPAFHVEIIVAKIERSEREDRSGKLFDTEGKLWSAYNKTLDQMQIGERYEVGFDENGTYRNVKTFKHITPYGHQPRESAEDRAAQKVAQVVRQAQPNETPRATAYNNNPGAAVMGMVNQYINRGDVPLNEDSIAQAIAICAAGYAKSKLGKVA